MLTYTPMANLELNWKPEHLERSRTCNMQAPHRKGQPTSAFKPGTTAPTTDRQITCQYESYFAVSQVSNYMHLNLIKSTLTVSYPSWDMDIPR